MYCTILPKLSCALGIVEYCIISCLVSSASLITLFCTGLVDIPLIALSTVTVAWNITSTHLYSPRSLSYTQR